MFSRKACRQFCGFCHLVSVQHIGFKSNREVKLLSHIFNVLLTTILSENSPHFWIGNTLNYKGYFCYFSLAKSPPQSNWSCVLLENPTLKAKSPTKHSTAREDTEWLLMLVGHRLLAFTVNVMTWLVCDCDAVLVFYG